MEFAVLIPYQLKLLRLTQQSSNTVNIEANLKISITIKQKKISVKVDIYNAVNYFRYLLAFAATTVTG